MTQELGGGAAVGIVPESLPIPTRESGEGSPTPSPFPGPDRSPIAGASQAGPAGGRARSAGWQGERDRKVEVGWESKPGWEVEAGRVAGQAGSGWEFETTGRVKLGDKVTGHCTQRAHMTAKARERERVSR